VPVQLVGTQDNVELALEIDRVDFLHEIIINGDRGYLHFDFELKHSPPFPRRVFVYNGMLTELKKPIPVISIPIYLKPRKKEIPKEYKVELGGYLFHKFTYEPILLWEHIDDIRSGKLYPLAPLLVVLSKEPSEETLVEERDLIVKHEPDPIRRRTLFVTAILTALAEKIFDSNFLWSFFKEENMLLAQDPVLKQWFNELYGVKLAEVEAKVAQEARQAEAKFAQAARQAERNAAAERQNVLKVEAALREAEAARRQAEIDAVRREAKAEAKAEAEAARREAEAKAEAAQREAEAKAEAKAEWLETVSNFLAFRFANTPIEVVLDLQRVPLTLRRDVINLTLDAPDLATFRQELKALEEVGKSGD
jgi:hypothetical protein